MGGKGRQGCEALNSVCCGEAKGACKSKLAFISFNSSMLTSHTPQRELLLKVGVYNILPN